MYAVISFSHKNTNVALREKLHFSNDENIQFLSTINKFDNILESILLSTCNRCEVYIFIKDINDLSKQNDREDIKNQIAIKICNDIVNSLAKFKNISQEILHNIALIELNRNAIHHVFCVASSLMSVVVGETQISGQMKEAYKLSYNNNLCSKELTRLFHFAFRCAASVRSMTDISKNSVSVASIATNIAFDFLNKEYKDSTKEFNALVVGVGEMGVICIKNLIKHNVKTTLCNRTRKNAEDKLKDLGLIDIVSIIDFNVLHEQINQYDIVFFAVSGGIIITQDKIFKTTKNRIFFDLSIPRNLSFDTKALLDSNISNIEVICVDDLKNKAEEHINARKDNIKNAMGIVGKFTIDFECWLSSLGVDPIIKTMRHQAKLASIKEIDRAIKKGFIPEALRNNVEKLLHSAFNEFLHSPTKRLKNISNDENSDSILESIANVFGVQDRILLNRYKCEYDDTKLNV